MKYFFRQVEEISLDNSPVSAEVYFRGENATGLIEKQFDVDQAAVLLFVNGEPGMAYLLEDGHGRSMSVADFLSLNDAHPRVINLPDVAGRLMLMALEAQVENKFSIKNDEVWKKQVDQWKQDRWNGLIEIKSKNLHGFSFFWNGEPQKSDLIFSTPQGFVSDFPSLSDTDDAAWDVITYSHHTMANAYQYAVLRQGVMHWSRQILSRYEELVGQKLLQMMDRELNRKIRPWRWHIVVDGKDMLDLHLFLYMMDAVLAYRALLMAMGAQMDFVIGNTLTQKLLSETFEQVSPDERVALKSQHLIPAAFSE